MEDIRLAIEAHLAPCSPADMAGAMEREETTDGLPLVHFRDCLPDHCDGLTGLSLELAHAGRDPISEGWDLELPPICTTPQPESERRNPPEGPGGN